MLIAAAAISCSDGNNRQSPRKASPGEEEKSTITKEEVEKTKVLGIEVINVYPHDSTAFTEGLLFHNGFLYESTGMKGNSSLRKTDYKTGRIIQKKMIDPQYFGEGIYVLNDNIYMLTWYSGVCFLFDLNTFGQKGSFIYQGEGWGLTYDGSFLIMSDGTNMLRYIDPKDFQVVRTQPVFDNTRPIPSLNELEYIDGKIYANIWMQDIIAVIDPISGKVTEWIDISPLRKYVKDNNRVDVLNGIAYMKGNGHLFLTGKYWPYLFEVKVTGN